MNVVTWDPFNNFNQIFSRYARYADKDHSDNKTASWSPLVDIYEAEDKFMVRAELPGVEKDAVGVSIEDNVLTIKGEKTFVEAKEGEQWTRVETRYGDFSRSFTLPEEVDVDKVDAAYKNGVLELMIPKLEAAKPKMIDVKVH